MERIIKVRRDVGPSASLVEQRDRFLDQKSRPTEQILLRAGHIATIHSCTPRQTLSLRGLSAIIHSFTVYLSRIVKPDFTNIIVHARSCWFADRHKNDAAIKRIVRPGSKTLLDQRIHPAHGGGVRHATSGC